MNTPHQEKVSLPAAETTFISIIIAISFGHFLNDIMQSMLPAIYPILRDNYGLTFLQIGLITTAYQITGSVLQPLIGFYADKRPLPYSLPFASAFTMTGLIMLAYAHSYYMLILAAVCVGFGSSIFHPEASRVARLASGGRYGFAQSVFQVGGNAGAAFGPLVAAYFITGQERVAWLAVFAFIGIIVLSFVSRWYAHNLKQRAAKKTITASHKLTKNQITKTLIILVGLMFAKYIYMASMQNYYTFYLQEKFHLSIPDSQKMLFLFLGGIAIGTIFGGRISDRIGARKVIWFSILGVLPFTLLLPYLGFYMTAILSVIIGMILASAFPAIVVYAQELMPGKVGTVAGFMFGLSFGISAIFASVLGKVGDMIGLENLFIICSFLPILGFIAMFLPKLESLPNKGT